MLTHEDLSKVRLLVLANKQDVKGCMTAAEISQERVQIILMVYLINFAQVYDGPLLFV